MRGIETMFVKRFFPVGGLNRFKANMATNVSHVSDNAAYVTALHFLKGWRNATRDELISFLSSAIEHLFEEPKDFRTYLASEEMFTSLHPNALSGFNGVFFSYFIQRLPIMLRCRRMHWRSPKSPTKSEIDEICEECIQAFTKAHEDLSNPELIQKWREQYRDSYKYTRFWVSSEDRDAYYYKSDMIEDFLENAMPEIIIFGKMAETKRVPEFMAGAVESKATQMGLTRSAWKNCFHLFIDRLSGSLDFAYPIYSSSVFDKKEK